MVTQTQSKGLQVREGRIELTAPYLDSERTFIYPPVRGIYTKCAEQLSEQGLYQPTFSEIVSLAHGAWQNSDEKYSKEIIKIMKDSWIRGFTGILYNKEGAYIQDKPQIVDGRVSMSENDLVRKLESKDSSVRFVPFGYKTGEQSSRALAKNPFVIALCGSEDAGKEQAEKLAEVADKYRTSPWLFSYDSTNEPIVRVSALDSYWGGYGLDVYGGNHGDDRDDYAFGVSAPKALQ